MVAKTMNWGLSCWGNRIALRSSKEHILYTELDCAAHDIAEAVGHRCLVFVLTQNNFGSIAGYIGFTGMGVVPLLLDAAINVDMLNRLVAHYRPEYLWLPAKLTSFFPNMPVKYSGWGYALLATGMSGFSLHPDLALLITTSGSTGTPKFVRQSYRNLETNTASICFYLGIKDSDKAITSLPMSYVYGLSVLNTHIISGASLILTEEPCFKPAFWELFRQEEGTSFAGVPFMYEMLDKLRFTRQDYAPSLSCMTQAGGRLSERLQQCFAEYAAMRGIDFVIMYGASEATARMSYLPPADCMRKRGSIGIPIPGGRFEIIGGDGREAEVGESGDLVFFGDNVALGYATKGEDLAKGDEWEGRLVTGDIGRVDDEGFYYITGRKKRFIKLLGRSTNLDEIEDLLREELGLTELACVGEEDRLRLFVSDVTAGEIAVERLYEITGINRRLVEVYVIDAIPKNSSGKTLYSQLERMVEGRCNS